MKESRDDAEERGSGGNCNLGRVEGDLRRTGDAFHVTTTPERREKRWDGFDPVTIITMMGEMKEKGWMRIIERRKFLVEVVHYFQLETSLLIIPKTC